MCRKKNIRIVSFIFNFLIFFVFVPIFNFICGLHSGFTEMIISYCIALIILLFYCGTGYFILEWIRRFTYWMRHGLLHETPNLFFGSIGGMGTTHFSGETTKKSYDRFVGRDVIAGIHFFMRPVVLILDPELIKNIMVKDFSNFINRGLYSNERDDPLSAHLFSLEDKKWRKLRSKMSPTFTTGKMKYMFDIVLQLAESMATYLEKAAETGCDVEFRDMFARYGTDVIAYCAFGIDCDSINNPETEFRQRSKKIFEPGVLLKLMLLLSVSFPSFSRLVRLKITDKKISKFFLEVVKQNIAYRQEKNIRRNDFFQILMDMGETNTNLKSKDVLSVNQIAAQAFIFFVGGFETSSTTLSFCLYELGKNHEIQDRLRNEIEQVIEKYGGITYDAIQNMTYMDQVINGICYYL